MVALDIEYHSTALENAGFRIRPLDILGYAPLRTTHDREPGIVLRTCRFDSLMAGVGLEVLLDDLGTNDDHLLDYATNSKNWKPGQSLCRSDPKQTDWNTVKNDSGS